MEAIDELYAEPPEGFIAAREAAAQAAREAGDAAAAKEIAALRKPTVAAWLVNRLALKRPDLVGGLAELSGSLRTAQRELRGEKLRELARQRRELVTSLVDEARRLAVEADPALAKRQLPLTDVEATLNAALADQRVAELVRSGRLLKTAAYEGFGELPEPSDEDRPSRGEIREAQKAAAQAEWEAQRTTDAQEHAQAALDELDERLEELRRQRKSAAEELSERRKEHTAAQRVLAQAQRRLSELER